MDAFLRMAIYLFINYNSEASTRGRKILFVKIPIIISPAPTFTFLTVMQIILISYNRLDFLNCSLSDIGGDVISYTKK